MKGKDDLLDQLLDAISEKTDAFKEILGLEDLDGTDMDFFERFGQARAQGSYKQEEDSLKYSATPPSQNCRYGWTDSPFLAFMGSLCPIEYGIVIHLIGLLFYLELNKDELEFTNHLISNLSDAMDAMAGQRNFQQNLQSSATTATKEQNLQSDLTLLSNQIKELQKQIVALKRGLDQ